MTNNGSEIGNLDYTKYTVHVVDDSEMIITMLTDLLRRKGYRTTSSKNGQEAIEFVKNELPHLIILDVEMPVLGGCDTIKILKSNVKTANVPVIFHTALTKPEVIENLFKLGASDYISKPFVPQELLARVEKEILNINLQEMLKDKMSKLAYALSLDPLTRLHNKTHITSVINSRLKKLEKEHNGIFSLIYIDIDDFDNFTRKYGVVTSENALKKIAMVLKRCVRQQDVVARWEGDVFIILCPAIMQENLKKISKDIQSKISQAPSLLKLNLTSSIILMEIFETQSKDNIIYQLQSKMDELKENKKGSLLFIE